jgi:RNA polymerase sigma-70 factor (ECF subfamily)
VNALEHLCRRYQPPLLAYVRGFGLKEHDAQDVTQSFFKHLLEKNLPARANPNLGRFRSFMLVSLRNFIHVTHRNASREKRGNDIEHVSLESAEHSHTESMLVEDSATHAFDRQWARTLIQISMDVLAGEQEAQGTTDRFALMRPLLLDPSGREAVFAELRTRFGMADGAARTCLSRLRTRFRELVRIEVERVVNDPAEADAEIAYLLRVLTSDTTS